MNEQKKRSKKGKFRKIFVLCTYTMYSVFWILLIIGLIPYKVQQKEVLQYQSDYKVKYRVNINDNTFYDSSSLEEGKQYISAITNSIDFNVAYVLNTSTAVNTVNTSNVSAKMVINYANSTDGNELWNTNIDLLKDETKSFDDAQNFNYERSFSIPFAEYRAKAEEFKEKYGLPITANIIVTINTSVKITNESTVKTVGTKTMTITIPLLAQTFSVGTSIPTSTVKKITIAQEKAFDPKKIIDHVGAIGLGICTVILTLQSTAKQRFESAKDRYLKAVDSYFTKYEEIIVRIDSMDNLKDLKVLNVKDFDDLLDIEEEIRSPILYYSDWFKKESYFMIVNGDYLYKFIIKGTSFVKNYYE
jgi:hypothetical protein